MKEIIKKLQAKEFKGNEITTFKDGDKEITTIKPQAIINLYNDEFGYGVAKIVVTDRKTVSHRHNNLAESRPIEVYVTGRLVVNGSIDGSHIFFDSPEVTKGWVVKEGQSVGNAFNAAESLLYPATARFLGIGKDFYLSEEDIVPETTVKTFAKQTTDNGDAITRAAEEEIKERKEEESQKKEEPKQEESVDKKQDPPKAHAEEVDERIAHLASLEDIKDQKEYVWKLCNVTEDEFKEQTGAKRATTKALREYVEDWINGKYAPGPEAPKVEFKEDEGDDEPQGDENPFEDDAIWNEYLLPEECSLEEAKSKFDEALRIGRANYEGGFLQWVAKKYSMGVEDIPQQLCNFTKFAGYATVAWVDLIKEYAKTLE